MNCRHYLIFVHNQLLGKMPLNSDIWNSWEYSSYFFFLAFLHVDHTLQLLYVNWFQSSSTKSQRGMVPAQYAWKMRNSPLSSLLLQTFSTKCSKRSHYMTEVKIFAFITHLFEHWPHPQPAKCSVCSNHSLALHVIISKQFTSCN